MRRGLLTGLVTLAVGGAGALLTLSTYDTVVGGGGAPDELVYFALSYEASPAGAACVNEHADIDTARTAGVDCDDTDQSTDGSESASMAGAGQVTVEGGFSVSSGDMWLSYDIYAVTQPTFTILMDAFRPSANEAVWGDEPWYEHYNPWHNRVPITVEMTNDGRFALNCNYPDGYMDPDWRSQIYDDAGVGSWANIVVHYDFDTRLGRFWIRDLDSSGVPTTTLNLASPSGEVDCSALGARGAVTGLSFSDFQHLAPATVYTDRWILANYVGAMP